MTIAIAFLVALALTAGLLYVAMAEERAVLIGFALVLSVMPSVQIPVAQVSLLFLACLAVGLAGFAGVHPSPPSSWIDILSITLVGLSAVAVLGHGVSMVALSDYLRWAAAVLICVSLRTVPARDLAAAARVFSYGTVVVALLSVLVLVAVLTPGSLLEHLTSLGDNGSPAVVAQTSEGAAARLAGPYVHPNIAAVFLVIGLILAAIFLRGPIRIAAIVILGVAIALTLSRAVMGGVVVSAATFVVLARGHRRPRAAVGGGLAVAILGVLAIPAVRTRLTDSFGPYDVGSAARVQALQSFTRDMDGYWWLGRGFGVPEFIDPMAASSANFAANAVLHTTLRSGVIAGLAFAALLVVAVRLAWRHLRSGQVERAVLGAGVIGLVLVPFQLDVPVVTYAPVTAAFSLLLAVLASDSVLPPVGKTA